MTRAARRLGARGAARGGSDGAPTSLRNVCEALEQIAPLHLAASWDNVGLLAGDLTAPVRRVMLCIDLMGPVVDEALGLPCDLVVAYHPPLFQPITRLVAPSDRMEAGVLRCIAGGVAVYSPHTSLDAVEGGTNDVLASLAGATSTRPITPDHATPDRGAGRVGSLRTPSTLARLARKLRRGAGAGCVSLVGEPDRPITRVLVCVGAAGSLPFEVDLGPHDAIVTGELRHHDALRVLRRGCCAVALSHWSSERPALGSLGDRLRQALPDLDVRLSEADREPFARV